MKKIANIIAVSAIAAFVASPALAAWDRTQVRDPAYSTSTDRQLETAAERLNPPSVGTGSSVATHDDVYSLSEKQNWFGQNLDRAAGREGPHNN